MLEKLYTLSIIKLIIFSVLLAVPLFKFSIKFACWLETPILFWE